jgi:SAM-dependent methyltransferase
MSNNIVLGGARNEHSCPRTVSVFLAGLKRISDLRGRRLLDVGCGDGTFTVLIGAPFEEVHGVDVQPDNIEEFKARVSGESKYQPHLTSATRLDFPDEYFDAVMSLECLEHVDDLDAVTRECARVLKPGGQLLITVPNRWYAIESHGGTIFGKRFYRLPLVNYVPWLHDRIAAARVFTVKRLDRLFVPLGFKRQSLTYLWPTFEHGGGPMQKTIQRLLRWTSPLMRVMETSPLRMFGASVAVRYRKESG